MEIQMDIKVGTNLFFLLRLGTSVTIGLPSFLTNANNEKLILVGYFIIFFVIVPLIVFACATRFQRFHDSGLMNNTVGLFVQFVEENWTAKFLVQTFSGAEEFAYDFDFPIVSMQCL